MSRAKTYETRTEEILVPIVADAGVSVYDVEYVKEGADWYLRVYIDKPEGVNINDCEVVNRALSAKMDELDFIEDAYILEVGILLQQSGHLCHVGLRALSPAAVVRLVEGGY